MCLQSYFTDVAIGDPQQIAPDRSGPRKTPSQTRFLVKISVIAARVERSQSKMSRIGSNKLFPATLRGISPRRSTGERAHFSKNCVTGLPKSENLPKSASGTSICIIIHHNRGSLTNWSGPVWSSQNTVPDPHFSEN